MRFSISVQNVGYCAAASLVSFEEDDVLLWFTSTFIKNFSTQDINYINKFLIVFLFWILLSEHAGYVKHTRLEKSGEKPQHQKTKNDLEFHFRIKKRKIMSQLNLFPTVVAFLYLTMDNARPFY